ncbi:MAG: trypsin-like peptidase domain-containing protein [Terriglobales bacterium]
MPLALALMVLGATGLVAKRWHTLARPTAADPGPAVLRSVGASVYTVEALDGAGQVRDTGSGVELRDGFIVTNDHVIRDAAALRLVRAGRQWTAVQVRCSQADDLCLIRRKGAADAAPGVRLAVSVTPGETVYALGAPAGIPLVISAGLLSGVRTIGGAARLVTSAPMSPGSSGGGLFDRGGELVGVTTAQVANGENLNLAVPASQVAALLAPGGGAAASGAPSEGEGVCIVDLGTTDMATELREWLQDGLVRQGVVVQRDCDRARAEIGGVVAVWPPRHGARAVPGRIELEFGLHLADNAGRLVWAVHGRRSGPPRAVLSAAAAALASRLLPALRARGLVGRR